MFLTQMGILFFHFLISQTYIHIQHYQHVIRLVSLPTPINMRIISLGSRPLYDGSIDRFHLHYRYSCLQIHVLDIFFYRKYIFILNPISFTKYAARLTVGSNARMSLVEMRYLDVSNRSTSTGIIMHRHNCIAFYALIFALPRH